MNSEIIASCRDLGHWGALSAPAPLLLSGQNATQLPGLYRGFSEFASLGRLAGPGPEAHGLLREIDIAGPRAARLWCVPEVYDVLSGGAQQAVTALIGGPLGSVKGDHRRVWGDFAGSLTVEGYPLPLDGIEIKGGTCPATGSLFPHLGPGVGFDVLIPGARRIEAYPSFVDPQWALPFSSALEEFFNTVHLLQCLTVFPEGRQGYLTKFPIGFGLYLGRDFLDQPLGFVVWGIHHEMKERLSTKWHEAGGGNKTAIVDQTSLAMKLGQGMYLGHVSGLIQSSPSLGNLSYLSDGTLVAHDLEGWCTRFHRMSRGQFALGAATALQRVAKAFPTLSGYLVAWGKTAEEKQRIADLLTGPVAADEMMQQRMTDFAEGRVEFPFGLTGEVEMRPPCFRTMRLADIHRALDYYQDKPERLFSRPNVQRLFDKVGFVFRLLGALSPSGDDALEWAMEVMIQLHHYQEGWPVLSRLIGQTADTAQNGDQKDVLNIIYRMVQIWGESLQHEQRRLHVLHASVVERV